MTLDEVGFWFFVITIGAYLITAIGSEMKR